MTVFESTYVTVSQKLAHTDASLEKLRVFATNTPVMFPFACQTALTTHINRFCHTESDTMRKMPVFNPHCYCLSCKVCTMYFRLNFLAKQVYSLNGEKIRLTY